ncbi:LLM class flavin-dependent oxidoreductase [Haloarchaeobius sp. DYHT-AS-18]|uniref:LLM class flavin-dependent oxidoreductase n=1 Tax=Haloarchaeobius sp. DYHT-AS-18 TaxID=3446117 RepID=UPI003EBE850F
MATSAPKHGLYLQNCHVYLGDLATPTNMLEYAVTAEEAGWDGVFMADGLYPEFPSIDPWTTLSGIATRTSDIVLGTWVTPVCRRLPWQLAHDLATLDHLSDGRVLLGAGLGAEGNYTTFGEEWDPKRLARRYDEALEIIDRLWTGDSVSYDGEFYTVEGAKLPYTPVQEPRIPILLGCWWPNKKPFQRAANWDGIMPAAPSFWGGEGEQGEPITGTVEEEVTALVEYYRGLTDGTEEILLPLDIPEAPDDFAELCRELGATWLLTQDLLGDDSHEENVARIREGPPV